MSIKIFKTILQTYNVVGEFTVSQYGLVVIAVFSLCLQNINVYVLKILHLLPWVFITYNDNSQDQSYNHNNSNT